MLRTDLFQEVVSAIKEMGFVPTTTSFILAVGSMSTLSNGKRERRFLGDLVGLKMIFLPRLKRNQC